MAKTIIIDGANYATNKLDTVELSVPVPCNGISFAESTANVSYGETYTITATVTPANTTDEIVWTSNNENFTVNNGVVTINGVGQAVITGTCGIHSATVTLTSTAEFDSSDFYAVDDMALSYANDYAAVVSRSGKFMIGRESTTNYHALWNDAATQVIGLKFCPYVIPAGSTTMTVTYSATYGVMVGFADIDVESNIGNGAVKIVSHDSEFIKSASRNIQIPNDASGFYCAVDNSDHTLLGIVFS